LKTSLLFLMTDAGRKGEDVEGGYKDTRWNWYY